MDLIYIKEQIGYVQIYYIDLMKEGIVSPNDVFDCLTPLVTTQNKLKEALQEKSPANHNIIETRFSILNNN